MNTQPQQQEEQQQQQQDGQQQGQQQGQGQQGQQQGQGQDSSSPLLGVVALVAPLATALAALALTGTIGRIQRNEPKATIAAFALVILGAAIWALASLPKRPGKWQIVAIGLAAVGTIVALGTAVSTAGKESRPRISASLNTDRTSLTTTISASNIHTDQRLAIKINALRPFNVPPPNEPPGTLRADSLYQAFVGPDNDGNVSQPITVPIPSGPYVGLVIEAYTGTNPVACDDFAALQIPNSKTAGGSGNGCVQLSLRPGSL